MVKFLVCIFINIEKKLEFISSCRIYIVYELDFMSVYYFFIDVYWK